MRPIDADALMGYTQNQITKSIECNDIARFHTVDAVPVVRCKDCRHCEIVDETQRYFCRSPLGTIGYIPVQPDDHCSYGMYRQ